jgi:hypothetical protein
MKSTTLSSIDYPVGIIEVTSQPSVSGNLTLGGALSISECDCTPRIQSRQIQWFKDGVAIAGANSTSYILTSNDYGSVFTAQIVMQVPGYASVTATTAPTQKMLQPIQALSKPSITYSALATGSTFTIQGGSYSPSQVSLAYTWFADGQQIPNQSGSSFTPGSEFGGKLISAQIVASANGYSSVTLKTDAVGPLLTVKTYTTTKLNPMTYFSNCGGTGYHTCARDSLGLSDNTNGMSVYASYSYSDSVCAMFGANVQDVDPSKMIRWRITAKGWAGSGVDRPALMPSTSTSWFDTVTSQMTLLSNDGTVTTNWLTTPMGGSQGHGLYWGVYHSDWGHYYIDYFQIEIQYYG